MSEAAIAELAAFVTARLAEDEAGWRAVMEREKRDCFRTNFLGTPLAERMLREVQAKRAILALHAPDMREYNNPFAGGTQREYEASCPVCEMSWPCPDVRHIASVWSDHPDFKEAWKS